MSPTQQSLSSATTLHEFLALGQVEAGLSSLENRGGSPEELDRLPLLLRWLVMARPRASIPDLVIDDSGYDDREKNGKNEENEEEEDEGDAVTDEVVRCLEDLAAMYSEAEDVQRVACDLAPKVCKTFLRSTKKSRGKRQTKAQQQEKDDEKNESESDAASSSSGEEQLQDSSMLDDSMHGEERTDAEDESRALLRVLRELVNEQCITDDSLLFLPEGKVALASLMHHMPTLKHTDVARIICQSGAPKRLLYVLAANCPSAVHSVLRGSHRHPAVAPLCPQRCRGDFGELLLDQDPLAAACQVSRGLLGVETTTLGANWSNIPESLQIRTIQCFIQELGDETLPGRSNIILKAFCLCVMFWNPSNEMFHRHLAVSDVTRSSRYWETALIVTAAWHGQPEMVVNHSFASTDLKDALRTLDPLAVQDAICNSIGCNVSLLTRFQDCLATLCNAIRADSMETDEEPQPTSLVPSFWQRFPKSDNHAEKVLKKIIACSKEEAEDLLHNGNFGDFLRQTVKSHQAKLPMIYTLQLEQLLAKFGYDHPPLLVQVLYCFLFMDEHPESPFIFDVRVLPLRRMRLRSRSYAGCKDLCTFIDRYAPEVEHIESFCGVDLSSTSPTIVHQAKARLSLALRNSMGKPNNDPDGLAVARAFQDVAPQLSASDLVATCASGLLSKGSVPAKFYTYSMIVRDPLCLFQCPIPLVWERSGTRRLLIVLLEIVLETNRVVSYEDCSSTPTVTELLACRDVLVLQCFLAALTTKHLSLASRHCIVAVSFVRKFVARRPGIATMLFRLGVTEAEQNWLIEWVPELIVEAPYLQKLLTESLTLSPSKRLTIAEACLRLTISQGFSSGSQSLATTALSQILTCLFSILGPVGVSVDVVLGGRQHQDNTDSTTVTRKAAFRMLQTVERIRSYRIQLRNECRVVLRKLLNYCKDPPAVGGRQKAVLKELQDAVAKAVDTLGGSGA